jgi:Protein of unknown function (DUF3303)
MKYVVSWHERAADSLEYEAAKKRLLEIFKDFKMPAGCTIHQCLVRVGEFGGYILLETNAEAETDTLGRILDPVYDRIRDHFRADFQFKVDPVVDVTDAVAAFMK